MCGIFDPRVGGKPRASPKGKGTIVTKTELKNEGSRNMACASNILPCLSLDIGPETCGPAGLPTSSF